MINELVNTHGWVSTSDGYSLSESHPFYVEGIFGGVRVIWKNNSVDFYEVGRLYDALKFHGLISESEFLLFDKATADRGDFSDG